MSVLLREAIGGSIRRARTERNRTLRDVSHSARVSLGYLSEIERGRKEPSSELLAAICEALSLPLPDLLDQVADTLRPDADPRTGARRPRPVAVLDPALRTAVEEALEDALEPDDTDDVDGAEPVEETVGDDGGAPAGDEAQDAARGALDGLGDDDEEPDDTDGTEDGEDVGDPERAEVPVSAPVVLVGRGTPLDLVADLAGTVRVAA